MSVQSILVHKEPASSIPQNAIFDRYVSHLRVQSEHTMGALKGRFQCLCELQVQINSKSEHVMACGWVMVAIILHNLIIDIKGVRSAGQFTNIYTTIEEDEDTGMDQTIHYEVLPDREAK